MSKAREILEMMGSDDFAKKSMDFFKGWVVDDYIPYDSPQFKELFNSVFDKNVAVGQYSADEDGLNGFTVIADFSRNKAAIVDVDLSGRVTQVMIEKGLKTYPLNAATLAKIAAKYGGLQYFDVYPVGAASKLLSLAKQAYKINNWDPSLVELRT